MPITHESLRRTIADGHLSLDVIDLTVEDFDVVVDVITQQNVAAVSIRRLDDVREILGTFIESLKTNTSLYTLDFSWCEINVATFRAIMDMLKHNRHILNLTFCATILTHAHLVILESAMCADVPIRLLQMNNAGISDEHGEFFERIIRANRTLQRLDLTCNKVGDNFCAHVARGLHTNTTLREMDFHGNQIGDDGCTHIVGALIGNQSMRVLNFTLNQIGDKAIEHLAKLLTAPSCISHLLLHGNAISDEGCKHVARVLQTNTTLEHLDLHANMIGDEGGHSLAFALHTNYTLAELNLRHNQMDDRTRLYIRHLVTDRKKRRKAFVASRFNAFQTTMIAGKIKTLPKHLMVMIHKYM